MARRGRPPGRPKKDTAPAVKRSLLNPEAEILDDDTAAHELVRLVRDLLPFTSFLSLKPPLEYRRYKALRNLCVLEELFHIEDDDICGRLRITVASLTPLREDKHYETMKSRVIEVVERLASPRKLVEWAADNEDGLALSLLKTAMWDGSTRDRTQALNSLLDRVSAKKGREEEAGAPSVPALPADLAKMAEMVFALGVALGKERGEGISGSTLNVPKLVGSSDTSYPEGE